MAARRHGGNARIGALMLALAVCLAALAALAAIGGGVVVAVALAWTSATFAWAGAAYLGVAGSFYAKDPARGTVPWIRKLLLLPFYTVGMALWGISRIVSKENPVDPLMDGVLMGRRLLAHEIPEDLRVLLDLTDEMDRPRLSPQVTYVSWPMLDGAAIEPSELREISARIEALPRPLLIHCAKGHGRTSMVAIAWLLTTGRSASFEDALAAVQKARPLAGPNPTQRKALDALGSA